MERPCPGAWSRMKVTHCPGNFAAIPWQNVLALRRKGVDARLVVFNRELRHPEADWSLDLPRSQAARQTKSFASLAPYIRGKTPDQLAYGRRADAQIVGSFDALQWVPEAHMVPPGLDLT